MKPSQTQEYNAAFFNALSHKRRQMLCDILLELGPNGISYGALLHKSGLKKASLSHHLEFMNRGGILRRQQKGRETWISINTAFLRNMAFDFGNAAIRA